MIRVGRARLIGTVAAAYILGSSAFAAQSAGPAAPEPANYSVRATRIQTGEAPNIDADLSDAAWLKATLIDDFRQVEPDSGAPGTERTVVRILYDENNIYFGIYCYDKEPEKIIVRTKVRDGPVFAEDFFRIALDPNLTKRDGYSFEVGPAGGREDALIQNNTNDLQRWNTIWQVRSRVVADGWIAEIAIPFRDFSYDPSNPDWGFDFIRTIRRKGERDRWASHNPAIAGNDLSQAGLLTGITDTNSGIGLDIKLYGRLAARRDWQGTPTNGLSGTLGATATYKLAQALNATLTLNPDFSDAPLDERLVNTTRFSLFTPESRDFFLQDAPAFEFGGFGFQGAPNAQPFFSRNLGLINGTPVSILGGGKLSGEFNNIGIGALSVRTNRKGATDAQTLSALRVTTPVFAQSKLGFIVTNGDPTGATRNTLAGADFQYRDTNFMGNKVAQADLYYERSSSSKFGDDDVFGAALNYPNEPWGGDFIFRQVGENFAPALGFVNRQGIRDYEVTVSQKTRYRDPFVRWMQYNLTGIFITGLDDQLQSSQIRFLGELATQQTDYLDLNVVNYFENVPKTFLLPRNVPVPSGKYNWTNIWPKIDTSRGRPLSVTWQGECCSFYNGSYLKSDLQLIFRPNETFEFIPRHVATFIDLPTGEVEIHILSASGGINFTPDMQLVLQGQFDNISRSFGFSARYRWEYEPGNELFVSFGQSALIPGTTFEAQTSLLSFRLGHTLRY